MKQILLALLLFAAMSLANAGSERGWFGVGFNIEGEGVFWDPTLQSITIETVIPGSPSAAAGLAKGDEVLEIEGRPIAGRKGKEVRAVLQSKAPGDKLIVKLKRPNGDLYIATLVAARRPAD
ncbi:MAG: PDZ domain-containing protein [Betaproteobacteria bacterium]|nr:PDZ domain-containing protein [Betaproteobacteria bacterium]